MNFLEAICTLIERCKINKDAIIYLKDSVEIKQMDQNSEEKIYRTYFIFIRRICKGGFKFYKMMHYSSPVFNQESGMLEFEPTAYCPSMTEIEVGYNERYITGSWELAESSLTVVRTKLRKFEKEYNPKYKKDRYATLDDAMECAFVTNGGVRKIDWPDGLFLKPKDHILRVVNGVLTKWDLPLPGITYLELEKEIVSYLQAHGHDKYEVVLIANGVELPFTIPDDWDRSENECWTVENIDKQSAD